MLFALYWLERDGVYMNVFERFSGKALPAEWSWMHEPAVWGTDDSNFLHVSAPPQADFLEIRPAQP